MISLLIISTYFKLEWKHAVKKFACLNHTLNKANQTPSSISRMKNLILGLSTFYLTCLCLQRLKELDDIKISMFGQTGLFFLMKLRSHFILKLYRWIYITVHIKYIFNIKYLYNKLNYNIVYYIYFKILF